MGAIVVGVLAVVGAALATGTFVDDDGNIHEGNIEAIAAEGITKGCNPPVNNRYCPGSNVSRGQMAAFLNRALRLPATSRDFFGDDDDSTFESDINRLAAAGITKGCNPPRNDHFCPEGKVTRGQMAAFLVRGFGYTAGLGRDLFDDDDGSVFEGDIDRLGTAGVTKGCNPPGNTRYCPAALVKRDQMASFLARALHLAPLAPPSGGEAQPSPPIRAAFMYPWFSEAWDQGGLDPFTQFTPSLGRYDSSAPGIIDQQVGLAKGAGLDAFINSWWGPGHHTDSATMDVLNRIPRSPNPDFRIAIYYEEEGHADPSAAAIKGDLEYLERFFSHPAYLRVDGKPVVFVWATGGDGTGMAARWSDAKRLYGGDVHIVLKVFSGYRDVADQPDSWHQYGPSTSYSEHLPHSAVVSPGFWHAKEASPRLGRDPARFRNDVEAMKASGAFWQLVTTWNEWGEGTSVEPATEFGSTYLDILADAFAATRTNLSP